MPKSTARKKMVVPPSRLYRRLAFSFLGAVIALLGVVLYYSFAEVTVIVKPRREALTATLILEVSEEPLEDTLHGRVRETVLVETRTFPLAGEGGAVVEVPATGRVIIANETSRDQPLVRTTRLLSPELVLFRIAETVTVPARGEVGVEVYADEPGPSGEIGPTRFTIPGLWEGLQDEIYARSDTAMCCGTKTVRTLTLEDIAQADAALTGALLEEARGALREAAATDSELGGEAFSSEVLEHTSDGEPGEERTEFAMTVKLRVRGVFYDRIRLLEEAREALKNLAGAERELVELDPERMTVTVERSDVATSEARLTVEATGLIVLRPDSAVFRKERLIGLDRAAVESYFRAFSSIESVRIEFRPPWLRRIPRLKDHIEIRIEE
ncbi:hypothetical protein HY478_03955 [Candidatus Uhrbacteria bacterium]|nr:hypothetical protein [Candidatus Uhrbacteria bacterium]